MVTLKALEAAVIQVEQIRDHEYTFEAAGTQITLRPLRAEEETDVQRHAQVAWEGVGEEGDVAAYAEFMDRVRLATLGYSIVRLGDTDLHDVDYVETGEQDENGNAVSMPKYEAIRDLIAHEWTKQMLTQVFSKFGELLERVEIEASKSVKFEASDLDEEIDRIEKRLVELKAHRDQKKPPDASSMQKQQKGVVKAEETRQRIHDRIRSQPGPAGRAADAAAAAAPTTRDIQEAVREVTDEVSPEAPAQEASQQAPPQPPQPEAPQQPQGRRSAIPDSAPPRERPVAPEESEGAQEPQQASPPVDQQGVLLPHDGDSFFDPADPDEALAAETQRQAQLHHQHMQRQRQVEMERRQREELGIPTEAELARERQEGRRQTTLPKATSLDKTGLRAAANVHNAVFDAGAGQVRSGRPQAAPSPGGQGVPAQLHGKPVYKMPTQTLDRPAKETQREHGDPAPSPVKINAPAGGRQGKFRGPGDQ